MKLIFIFMNQWAHVKSRLHHMGGRLGRPGETGER